MNHFIQQGNVTFISDGKVIYNVIAMIVKRLGQWIIYHYYAFRKASNNIQILSCYWMCKWQVLIFSLAYMCMGNEND